MDKLEKSETKVFIFYTAGDYIHTPSTGGTRRYRELLEHFLEAGDKIYLLAPENINLQKGANLFHIPLKTYQSSFLPNGLLNFFLNLKAFRLAKNINADGVVLFSVPYAIQGILAGLDNISVFIREDIGQNIYFQDQKSKGLSRYTRKINLFLFKLIEKYTLSKVQKVILPGNYAKNALESKYPGVFKKLEKKTYVLYNNINAGWMLSYSGYIRQKPVPAGNIYRFVFAGRLNTCQKGLHLLLSAVQRLTDEGYPVRLDVIGDGALKSEYEHRWKDYSCIKFLGWMDEPMKVLSDYDLLIVPSLFDAFPNVVLEGLFLEIPVIGSLAGGIAEILLFQELMFDPQRSKLKEKLQEIIEGGLLENYRQKCIRRKQALTFNWGEEARQIVSQ
ncbi:MAG: glycosyltransferase [Bacteroidota bacterium]